MPKRIYADPERGYPGTIEENGTRVQGMHRYVAYVYGPGEVPHAYAETIAQLRQKYWDPARRALVIPPLKGAHLYVWTQAPERNHRHDDGQASTGVLDPQSREAKGWRSMRVAPQSRSAAHCSRWTSAAGAPAGREPRAFVVAPALA
jgi:hypothetical protein